MFWVSFMLQRAKGLSSRASSSCITDSFGLSASICDLVESLIEGTCLTYSWLSFWFVPLGEPLLYNKLSLTYFFYYCISSNKVIFLSLSASNWVSLMLPKIYFFWTTKSFFCTSEGYVFNYFRVFTLKSFDYAFKSISCCARLSSISTREINVKKSG